MNRKRQFVVIAVIMSADFAQVYPGSRDGHEMVHLDNNTILIFGGNGYGSSTSLGYLNDLWKYDIAANRFTFLKGSQTINDIGNYGTLNVPAASNQPSGRPYIKSVVANSFFYCFGGQISTTYLNDLWRYDLTSNQWTWLASTTSQVGNYPPKGIYGTQYYPGARYLHDLSVDSTGTELILFGGYGYATTSSLSYLNDVWHFRLSDRAWGWTAGSSARDEYTSLTTSVGQFSAANRPGGRGGMVFTCSTGNTNCYIIGGYGLSTSLVGLLNDVWVYDQSTKQFAFLKGSSSNVDLAAVLGTKGVSASGNNPGSFYAGCGFFDRGNNRLVIFGGNGRATTASIGYLSDVWSFDISSSQWTWLYGSGTINSPAIANTNPGARQLHPISFTSGQSFYLFGGEGFGLSSPGALQDLWRFDFTTSAFTFLGGTLNLNVPGDYVDEMTSSTTRTTLTSSTTTTTTTTTTSTSMLTTVTTTSTRTTFSSSIPMTTTTSSTSTSTTLTSTSVASQTPTSIISSIATTSTTSYLPSENLSKTTSSTEVLSSTLGSAAVITEMPTTSASRPSTATSKGVSLLQSFPSSSLPITLLLIAISFIILITIIAIVFCYCRRRRQAQQLPVIQEKFEQPNDVSSESMTSQPQWISISSSQYRSASNSGTLMLGIGTTMFTQNQMNMALPGFLEVLQQDFRLLNQIAKGGGGEVHFADGLIPSLSSQGQFVAKVLTIPSHEARKARVIRSFQQEVSIMYLFRDHPNIAKLVGYCSTPPVILVKYYALGSLERLMDNSIRSKRYMLPIMQGIANGLNALHRNGIVHCDLKPDNVLLELSNYGLNAVLSDFGISRVVAEKVLTVTAFEVVTIRGLTYLYAAPEVFDEMSRQVPVVNPFITKQRDVFSFAVIICAYLLGQKPWS